MRSMLEPTGLPGALLHVVPRVPRGLCARNAGLPDSRPAPARSRRPGGPGTTCRPATSVCRPSSSPASGDVRSCARAFKMGVVDFLQKPIDGSELLDCVLKGSRPGRRFAGMPSFPHALRGAVATDPREKGASELLVTGKTLKQIAARFGVTVQSVWKHQQHIFQQVQRAERGRTGQPDEELRKSAEQAVPRIRDSGGQAAHLAWPAAPGCGAL